MSEGGRRFLGVWVPAALWLNEELMLGEKWLLLEIDSLSNADGICYADDDELGRYFTTGGDVFVILKGLAQDGWIVGRVVDGIRKLRLTPKARELLPAESSPLMPARGLAATAWHEGVYLSPDAGEKGALTGEVLPSRGTLRYDRHCIGNRPLLALLYPDPGEAAPAAESAVVNSTPLPAAPPAPHETGTRNWEKHEYREFIEAKGLLWDTMTQEEREAAWQIRNGKETRYRPDVAPTPKRRRKKK